MKGNTTALCSTSKLQGTVCDCLVNAMKVWKVNSGDDWLMLGFSLYCALLCSFCVIVSFSVRFVSLWGWKIYVTILHMVYSLQSYNLTAVLYQVKCFDVDL